MDARQYRWHLDRLGLTQMAASRFLGISPRQSRRFAKLDDSGAPAEESPIPNNIAVLLRLMVCKKINVEQACKIAGLDIGTIILEDDA